MDIYISLNAGESQKLNLFAIMMAELSISIAKNIFLNVIEVQILSMFYRYHNIYTHDNRQSAVFWAIKTQVKSKNSELHGNLLKKC